MLSSNIFETFRVNASQIAEMQASARDRRNENDSTVETFVEISPVEELILAVA